MNTNTNSEIIKIEKSNIYEILVNLFKAFSFGLDNGKLWINIHFEFNTNLIEILKFKSKEKEEAKRKEEEEEAKIREEEAKKEERRKREKEIEEDLRTLRKIYDLNFNEIITGIRFSNLHEVEEDFHRFHYCEIKSAAINRKLTDQDFENFKNVVIEARGKLKRAAL